MYRTYFKSRALQNFAFFVSFIFPFFDMMVKEVVVVHGGELAGDIAKQLVAKKPETLSHIGVDLRNASERPKKLLEKDQNTVICFILQTIENGTPTEEVSTEEEEIICSMNYPQCKSYIF